MADNTEINPGTGGDVIASDDIGGVKHQRVKMEFGEDGSATDVSATDPLPVDTGDDEIAILETIASAIQAVASAKGILQDLRVSVLGGAVTISSGTITTVTTVASVTNIAQIGGLLANPYLQGQANMAAIQSNINNVIVS